MGAKKPNISIYLPDKVDLRIGVDFDGNAVVSLTPDENGVVKFKRRRKPSQEDIAVVLAWCATYGCIPQYNEEVGEFKMDCL